MTFTETNLASRIFRSATFEGMADDQGIPSTAYHELYLELAQNGVKHLITGCTYISREGKMVQPGQAGIDTDDSIRHYQKATSAVHQFDAKIYLQISHAGRQTSSLATGKQVVGASPQRSGYFRSKPKAMNKEEISGVVDSFAKAAWRAKAAGFDGVQIHAAHGYLVHQFLHPYLNRRTDEYGIDKHSGIGGLFLQEVFAAIRNECGVSFPILVKISAADDLPQSFSEQNFLALIELLHSERVFAIEISYGTMENALNIFRGQSVPQELILKHNFRYKTESPTNRKLWKWLVFPLLNRRLKSFEYCYNLPYAALAKLHTDLPIICVGGFRTAEQIRQALESNQTDYVSLCRPFLCEPDFITRLNVENGYISRCVNCNSCAIMCDSMQPTRCYRT